jgi:hypothetical protein
MIKSKILPVTKREVLSFCRTSCNLNLMSKDLWRTFLKEIIPWPMSCVKTIYFQPMSNWPSRETKWSRQKKSQPFSRQTMRLFPKTKEKTRWDMSDLIFRDRSLMFINKMTCRNKDSYQQFGTKTVLVSDRDQGLLNFTFWILSKLSMSWFLMVKRTTWKNCMSKEMEKRSAN